MKNKIENYLKKMGQSDLKVTIEDSGLEMMGFMKSATMYHIGDTMMISSIGDRFELQNINTKGVNEELVFDNIEEAILHGLQDKIAYTIENVLLDIIDLGRDEMIEDVIEVLNKKNKENGVKDIIIKGLNEGDDHVVEIKSTINSSNVRTTIGQDKLESAKLDRSLYSSEYTGLTARTFEFEMLHHILAISCNDLISKHKKIKNTNNLKCN